MNLTVLPQQVVLNRHDLLNLRESERFLACFGRPSRQREIPMHPSGTRVAMVWDEIGLVAYEDRPERLMSHLYLAFSPLNTPEHPSKGSQCVIEINGGIVTAETSERTLPRSGPTPISVDHGKHFFYEAELYSASFLFGRRANPRGREVVAGSLESFSFSWRKSPA
jgi:hypothetical protein